MMETAFEVFRSNFGGLFPTDILNTISYFYFKNCYEDVIRTVKHAALVPLMYGVVSRAGKGGYFNNPQNDFSYFLDYTNEDIYFYMQPWITNNIPISFTQGINLSMYELYDCIQHQFFAYSTVILINPKTRSRVFADSKHIFDLILNTHGISLDQTVEYYDQIVTEINCEKDFGNYGTNFWQFKYREFRNSELCYPLIPRIFGKSVSPTYIDTRVFWHSWNEQRVYLSGTKYCTILEIQHELNCMILTLLDYIGSNVKLRKKLVGLFIKLNRIKN
jgi:hypothetical protein